jgi:glycosyltransferase involved in cell wall biosynthesis
LGNFDPILSIVIPTYNRASLLEFSLGHLISNLLNMENSSLVEIVISDNHSTDNTSKIVTNYINNNNGLLIKYNRNSTNLGFDRNCIEGAKLCSGRFIWFVSDDDIIKSNSLEYLICEIQANLNVKFIFLNYTVKTPGWAEGSPLYLDSNKVVDCNDLIISTKMNFSCITACVFEKNAFLSVDKQPYIGTFWIHMYIVRDVASLGKSLVISRPMFTFNRPGLKESRLAANKIKTTQREFFIDAHINAIKYTVSFSDNYSFKSKNYAFNLVWNDNLSQILSYKLTVSKYNFKEILSIYSDMKLFYSNKLFFWIFHIPILFSGRIVASSYFSIKYLFAKVKQSIKPFIPNKLLAFYKNS